MNIKDIVDNLIFLCRAGSHAYGTNTVDSDIDIRGVCIPDNLSYYFGMGINKFEQKDSGWDNPEDDKVIYDLRKTFRLMADNNPNMLDFLFIDEKDIIETSTYWKWILEHREKFLSKKCRHTYGGYAFAQLKRINSHRNYLLNPPKKKPERKDFNLPDNKLISQDQMGAFQWLIAKLLHNSIEEMNLSDETKEELYGVNYIGLIQSGIPNDAAQTVKELTGAGDAWIDSVMREKQYDQAMRQWKSYFYWKATRNTKRFELEKRYGYDTKHAMHLVRLLRMGMEILEKSKVNVFRPDREELKEIRSGTWSYEKLVSYAEECDKKMNELYKTSNLPKQPDRVFLDRLCQDVIRYYVGR
jgi:predicted nucleotidyltransferase